MHFRPQDDYERAVADVLETLLAPLGREHATLRAWIRLRVNCLIEVRRRELSIREENVA